MTDGRENYLEWLADEDGGALGVLAQEICALRREMQEFQEETLEDIWNCRECDAPLYCGECAKKAKSHD